MLLKTKLVATGVAATLATGAGISALNFEVSQDSKEKFDSHQIAIEQSAEEMNGAQSIITRLGSKIDGLVTNLTTANSDMANAKQEAVEAKQEAANSDLARQKAENERDEAKQEAAENDRARKDAKLEVSKANFEIRKANRAIEKLAERSDAQTKTLNNSKVKLEDAMKSAQNYLNDTEASTQNK